MTRTLAFAVSLAVFALGGYWLGGKREHPPAVFAAAANKPLHCKQNDCETKVTVLWDCASGCVIAVRDDVMIVKKGKKITWTVTTNEYKFADASGITFVDAGNFDCTLKTAQQIECKAKNNSADETAYKYKVALVNAADPSNGPKPPDLDPYVVNN